MLPLLIFVALLVLGLLLVLILELHMRSSNTVVVDPNKRERVIVSNVLEGTLRVLRPGTYGLSPQERVLETISTNEDPIVPPPERIRTSDDIEMNIVYGYSMRIRRSRNPKDSSDSTLSEEELLSKYALHAVTRIDKAEERRIRVQREIAGVIDQIFRELTADQLKITKDHQVYLENGKIVHYNSAPSPLPANVEEIRSAKDLYHALQRMIETRVNEHLVGELHDQSGIGMEIINFRIHDVQYFNPDVQKRAEKKHESGKINDAVKELMTTKGLNAREAFIIAIGQDDSFAALSQEQIRAEVSRAWIDLSREIKDAVQNHLPQIIESITHAIDKRSGVIVPPPT